MAPVASTPRPSSLFLARAAIAAALVALAALAALHFLRADLRPADHMISEYAVGAHGWVITVFFLSCALSSATLAAALLRSVVTRTAKVGLGFLVLAVAGLVLGGLFPMDPVTTPHDALSFSGRMHGVGFMIGVPSELFAVLLLSLSARRGSLLVLAGAVWLSLVVMVPLIASGHGFGIPNRTFMLFYAAWLVLAAVPAAARPRGDQLQGLLHAT